MSEAKEKNTATAEEMANILIEFLRNEIVCFIEKREGGVAVCLSGGKKFFISIQEE